LICLDPIKPFKDQTTKSSGIHYTAQPTWKDSDLEQTLRKVLYILVKILQELQNKTIKKTFCLTLIHLDALPPLLFAAFSQSTKTRKLIYNDSIAKLIFCLFTVANCYLLAFLPSLVIINNLQFLTMLRSKLVMR
jgi:hypothetical protein